MATQEKEELLKGLGWLDDEALARIVEADLEDHSELKSPEAKTAFAELARRSGLEGW